MTTDREMELFFEKLAEGFNRRRTAAAERRDNQELDLRTRDCAQIEHDTWERAETLLNIIYRDMLESYL